MSVFSLPTQRCFVLVAGYYGIDLLFSAYAEVFLLRTCAGSREESFLCLRRGVSYGDQSCTGTMRFSLPTQRCFP